MSRLISTIRRIPFIGHGLSYIANKYPEGSIVRVKTGRAAGLKWQRFHRYVNGYWVGNYEPAIQERIWSNLNEGDTFYDVGANAGFFSLIAARRVGTNGLCVSVEPDDDSCQSIEAQRRLNGFAHWIVKKKAVAALTGAAHFQRISEGNPMSRLADNKWHLNGAILVETITLDDLAAEVGNPSLIKVDVEGAEVQVLEGGTNVLQNVRPKWLIETHGSRQHTEVSMKLSQLGYNVQLIGNQNGICHLFASP